MRRSLSCPFLAKGNLSIHNNLVIHGLRREGSRQASCLEASKFYLWEKTAIRDHRKGKLHFDRNSRICPWPLRIEIDEILPPNAELFVQDASEPPTSGGGCNAAAIVGHPTVASM